MNENLDLVEILKDCPVGTKLYSTIHGEVVFTCVRDHNVDYPIGVSYIDDETGYTRDGRFDKRYDGECVLFPSKDQRDWSKFKVPAEKFDYSSLHSYDRVLVRDSDDLSWRCNLLSHRSGYRVYCLGTSWVQMIPFNDETKHLVGTTDRPDEKYIWWEG